MLNLTDKEKILKIAGTGCVINIELAEILAGEKIEVKKKCTWRDRCFWKCIEN